MKKYDFSNEGERDFSLYVNEEKEYLLDEIEEIKNTDNDKRRLTDLGSRFSKIEKEEKKYFKERKNYIEGLERLFYLEDIYFDSRKRENENLDFFGLRSKIRGQKNFLKSIASSYEEDIQEFRKWEEYIHNSYVPKS